MAALDLPRVLYVGDIQIENSHHSSAQLFRLLSAYPPSLLRVIETWTPSRVERRLPQVEYFFDPIAPGVARVGRGAAFAWHAATATHLDSRLRAAVRAFGAQVVLTIGYGFGWIAGARLARRLELPLLFIAHDEWPKLRGSHHLVKASLRRRFAAVYRQAHTRLCVSPLMANEFQQRYGRSASVMYPVRGVECAAVEPSPPRTLGSGDEMVIGFCGATSREVMPGLLDLAAALAAVNGRLIIYGPIDVDRQRELTAVSASVEFPGFAEYGAMLAGLRARADVVFTPMSFDPDAADNTQLSFPSKLAEYTALGLPILVHGPGHCSAAHWANSHDDAAEVVTTAGSDALVSALARLKADPGRRDHLARHAAAAAAMFRPSRGRADLQAALVNAGAGVPHASRA